MGGDSHHHEQKKVNKPSNSNFRQQRLVAWQPIMSPPHVVACLFVVAAAFLPIGVAIIMANKDVYDKEWAYGQQRVCSLTNNDGLKVFTWNNHTTRQGCVTLINFSLAETLSAPVYLYYGLDNFYQNHRRFAKSRSTGQLAGGTTTSSDCDPIRTPGDINSLAGTPITIDGQTTSYGSLEYSPCGLVAWSMFNDSFTLYRSGQAEPVCNGSAFDRAHNTPLPGAGNCTKKGITWESDGDKFKRPAFGNNIWTGDRAAYGEAAAVTTDPFFANGWYAGEPFHSVPITTDEDLQVWMRTAALPKFRKLYRVINADLPAGDYTMRIDEYYPVDGFSGKKTFAISTLSWLGGKNSFLGIGYLVVGGLAFILAIVFFVIYKANGDRMQSAIDSLSELQ